MKNFVIYTAIVGEYDEISQPLVVDDRFDYILFSNDIKVPKVGVWRVRPINYYNVVQTKIARWVKTHPEELLPEYECSVWLDARIIIKSQYIYDKTVELYDSKNILSLQTNPDFNCIYKEMIRMLFLQWEEESVILSWGHHLREENYPRNIGTKETGLLYRKHSDKTIKQFDELWWWCIENYSRRDQFSFNYVLWKLKITSNSFLPDVLGVRTSKYLCLNNHTNHKNKKISEGKCSLLLHYYYRHADETNIIVNAYYWIYGRKNPKLWLGIVGIIFAVKHVVMRCLGKKNNYEYKKTI
ncbi:MAG: DUF616 domain-containing protein [Salinivirgaceae bacterium]|nr:DUF616 domain-containing protein [Salinivirgaceae bacterium]